MSDLRVDIDYREAAVIVASARASARNLMSWCDRLDKLLDEAKQTNERVNITMDPTG